MVNISYSYFLILFAKKKTLHLKANCCLPNVASEQTHQTENFTFPQNAYTYIYIYICVYPNILTTQILKSEIHCVKVTSKQYIFNTQDTLQKELISPFSKEKVKFYRNAIFATKRDFLVSLGLTGNPILLDDKN